MSREIDWSVADESSEAIVPPEHPLTHTTVLLEPPTTTSLLQSHGAPLDSIIEDEDSDLEEPYEENFNEEFEAEHNDNKFHVLEEITVPHEDQECFMNDVSYFLKEDTIKGSMFEPLLPMHVRPPDSSMPHLSSPHAPSIQAPLDFFERVEMVIYEQPKSDKEILLSMLGAFQKRRRQWKNRKKKKSFESYLSIDLKIPKLLSREHETSLKKVKHLVDPRPKPPYYP